jgi:hypothetical protein
MIQIDSERGIALTKELKSMQYEIARLKLIKHIPDDFKEIKATMKTNAFGVLEAMLNLVGQQLVYFGTNLGKVGRSYFPRLTDECRPCT